MKFQNMLSVFVALLLLSCGSTESVITEDGKIYEVKGDTFKTNGLDVTDQLTNDEKERIKIKLQEKIDSREALEKRQKELKSKAEELEKTQKETKKKQEELEELQKEFERKQKEKKEVTANYIKAKKELEKQNEKYERLKEKGKLSPRDETDWKEKLDDLKDELKVAKQKMDNLNSLK